MFTDACRETGRRSNLINVSRLSVANRMTVAMAMT